MPTIKQRVAADLIVENRGNISKSMLQAGYDATTAKNPKNLTESRGYKEILDEYGLTEGLIVLSLVEDIKSKPQNRKAELELGAKIRQMMTEKVDITSNGKDLQLPVVRIIDERKAE
jgi:hypothetical protein